MEHTMDKKAIWALIKKNGFFYVLYLGILLSLMAAVWLTSSSEVDIIKIGFHAAWLIMIILGSLSVTEQNEEKSNGYSFLRILPIRNDEIVFAKFSLVFAAAVVNVVFNYILYHLRAGTPEIMALGRIIILFCANLALIVSGLAYIYIYRKGLNNLQKLMWISVAFFALLPFIFYEFVLKPMNLDLSKVQQFIISRHWLLWVGMSLGNTVVFFLLMKLTIRIKERQK